MSRSLTLACFLVATWSGAAAQAAPSLPVGHAGRWLTDSRGRVVIVHGLNMVYKLAPYYPAAVGFGDDDASFLAANGFNAVRLGVIWKAVEPRPGVYDDAYLKRIAGTVRTLARHGILSLLDFHQDLYNERFHGEGAPNWAVQDDGLPAVPQFGFPADYILMPAVQHAFDHFWANSRGPSGIGLQDRFAGAWRHVAGRFRDSAALLGYELFNEPFPGTTYFTCASSSGCPGFDAKLTAFNRKVDSAIRRADGKTLVWYEPNVLFDYGFATNVGGLRDPRAGFSFHDYCFSNEAAGCPSHATNFTLAASHVARTGETSMLTEFGATNSAPDLSSMVALADRNMTPWLEWAYCGCQDPTGAGNLEALVLDPTKPPSGANVVIGTLRALVEPYPQVVAGTPRSWSFDRATNTFRLRYATHRASRSGMFAAGSITEISTPALIYGGHYAASVSGGTVVSARGAPLLRVASLRRATTIAVTVRPMAH